MRRRRRRKRNKERRKQFRGHKVLWVFVGMSAATPSQVIDWGIILKENEERKREEREKKRVQRSEECQMNTLTGICFLKGRKRNKERREQFIGHKVHWVFVGMSAATPSQVFGLYYWGVIPKSKWWEWERGRKRNEERRKQFRGHKVLRVLVGMSAATPSQVIDWSIILKENEERKREEREKKRV